MNNQLMMFENHNVEILELDGVIYFNPYHVGECLTMAESTVKNHLAKMNENQARLIKNSDVRLKDFRKLNNAGEKFLTESGVYKLVFKSEKKEAEKFSDWVTDKVLPTIRKTGSFTSKEVTPFEDKLEHLKLEQQGLKFVLDLIKPSQSSTVKMLRDFNESQGLTTAYLPIYVDEQVGISVSSLLKEFNVNLSAVKFNELLIKHGILEVQQRKSTTNVSGFRDYKVLTDKGLEYGKNEISTRGSEKQSQPLYYKSKFQELLNLVNCEVAM